MPASYKCCVEMLILVLSARYRNIARDALSQLAATILFLIECGAGRYGVADGECSGADGGAHGGGDALGPQRDVFGALGFHHDASLGFGTRVAEHDAAGISQSLAGFAEGAGNFGNLLEGGLERTLTLMMVCG